MLRGKTRNLIYLQCVYFIYSLGTVASKKASEYPFLSRTFIKFFIIELMIMLIYAFLWQQVIKRFELVIAYSHKGIVMLWTLIWSSVLFKEHIKFTNILGIIIIALGIFMVVRDDK